MFKKIVPLGMILAYAGCSNVDGVSDSQAENGGTSKPPLAFDDASILVPPDLETIRARFSSRVAEDQAASKPLSKAASTYYTYGENAGLNINDYRDVYTWHGSGHCPQDHSYMIPGFWKSHCPQNMFFEATYSARFNSYPEQLWTRLGSGYQGLQTADLGDNEQAELQFYWDMSVATKDFDVTVKYEVSSELNYDFLHINSTGPVGTCNSPGVARKKVSGQDNGTVSFTIPRSCGTGWLGIYFIKDYSVSHYNDNAKILSVDIRQQR